MLVLIHDLKEILLKEPDLSDIFWRKEDSAGVDNLTQSIWEQYLQLRKLCSSREDQDRLRDLVSHTVVLGAIRGLQWGVKLKDREKRRKCVADDQIVKCIIKHPTLVRLLLKTPKVSTRSICLALDKTGEVLPWRALAKVERLWTAHYKHATVKNAIKRARNKVRENVADIKYLERVYELKPLRVVKGESKPTMPQKGRKGTP